jgi:hypothetical protein
MATCDCGNHLATESLLQKQGLTPHQIGNCTGARQADLMYGLPYGRGRAGNQNRRECGQLAPGGAVPQLQPELCAEYTYRDIAL